MESSAREAAPDEEASTDYGAQTDSWAHLGAMRERGGSDYPELVAQMRRVQDSFVAAHLPAALVPDFAEQLGELADRLAEYEAEESATPAGSRLDLPGRGHPFLLPHIVDQWSDTRVEARVTFTPFHLGGNGAAHGGSLPLLFDEVLGRLANSSGRSIARTAYIHVNYRHITPVGKVLRLEATLDREEGRKRYASGRLLDGDVVVSDAEGLFVALRPGQP